MTMQRTSDVLDAAIFGPARNAVRDVLIAGHYVVRDGRHPYEEMMLDRYRKALARLVS